jgi:hypothetical protein
MGIAKRTERYGSSFKPVVRKKLRYIPSIKNSPWAKFIIFRTPKIIVRPIANRA